MPRHTYLSIALGLVAASTAPAQARFSISFPAAVHPEPITGRVFLFLSHDSTPEPRIGVHPFQRGIPLFGADVAALRPGDTATIGDTTLGFPFTSLKDVPAGDYYVQALVNVYTEVHRSDGHTLWVHWDQWEGQQFNTSPGNLYSSVVKVHLDPAAPLTVSLALTKTIPARDLPADSKWVKRIRIQSDLLSKFWGQDRKSVV